MTLCNFVHFYLVNLSSDTTTKTITATNGFILLQEILGNTKFQTSALMDQSITSHSASSRPSASATDQHKN